MLGSAVKKGERIQVTEPKDLRTFIAAYEKDYPEDVIRVSRPVSAEFVVSAIVTQLAAMKKYPLLIFERVINIQGHEAQFPCIVNVLGDRRKMAYAIGSDVYNVALDWANMQSGRGEKEPVVVARNEAPCQQNVKTGEEVNLLELPILRHHEMDPGPYITAGMLVSYDPETWTPNMGFHRGFVAGPREIRCYLTAKTHSALNLRAHESAGKEMKVAYWVGHHPAVIMGAHVQLPYPGNHYRQIAAVSGEPVRLVPSVSLGDDFLVPADAEFVIEGIIRPGKRALEGPFGEYPRYYGPQQMSPVIEVTALSYRDSAIWHSFMVGVNNNYSSVRMERNIYAAVKRAVPQVQRVCLPVSGCGNLHAYIQIRKTNDGQPKQAIMAALAASPNLKHVVVVDDDIDVYNEEEVLWAVATRSQWDKDLVVIPGCFGPALDPSSERGELDSLSAKGGIDATKPAPPRRFASKLNVPEEIMKANKIWDYIPAGKLDRVPRSF